MRSRLFVRTAASSLSLIWSLPLRVLICWALTATIFVCVQGADLCFSQGFDGLPTNIEVHPNIIEVYESRVISTDGVAVNPPANVSATQKNRTEDELDAIRAEADAFIAAFNAGDAKGIAALWTADGEYTDETGRSFTGRDEIEKEYASFFAEHRGLKINLLIESLKLLSDTAAIEDGRVILDPSPQGPPAISKYTAVHVKVDGKWLMSLVRDSRIEIPSAYRNLQSLEWLIGSWHAEEHGHHSDVTCRWVANKSYVQRTYWVTGLEGLVIHSGIQIIGWNPQAGQIDSWTFASDGGHSVDRWTPNRNGWTIVSHGWLASGQPTSASTVLNKLDDGAMSWQSVSRSVAGTALLDTDQIILKKTSD